MALLFSGGGLAAGGVQAPRACRRVSSAVVLVKAQSGWRSANSVSDEAPPSTASARPSSRPSSRVPPRVPRPQSATTLPNWREALANDSPTSSAPASNGNGNGSGASWRDGGSAASVSGNGNGNGHISHYTLPTSNGARPGSSYGSRPSSSNWRSVAADPPPVPTPAAEQSDDEDDAPAEEGSAGPGLFNDAFKSVLAAALARQQQPEPEPEPVPFVEGDRTGLFNDSFKSVFSEAIARQSTERDPYTPPQQRKERGAMEAFLMAAVQQSKMNIGQFTTIKNGIEGIIEREMKQLERLETALDKAARDQAYYEVLDREFNQAYRNSDED